MREEEWLTSKSDDDISHQNVHEDEDDEVWVFFKDSNFCHFCDGSAAHTVWAMGIGALCEEI